MKIAVLKKFAKLIGKHLCQSLFLILLKRDSGRCFCDFCETFKNTFFIEHLRWLLLKSEMQIETDNKQFIYEANLVNLLNKFKQTRKKVFIEVGVLFKCPSNVVCSSDQDCILYIWQMFFNWINTQV